jgi:hypothetical protein
MSKHHKGEQHDKSEHAASRSQKVLGFELPHIALMAVLVLGAAIVATTAGFSAGFDVAGKDAEKVVVSEAMLMKSVEKYVNDNLITDSTVSVKVLDANYQGNGLYELPFEVYQNGAVVSSGNLYANKEKLILGQVFDLSTALPKPEPANNTQKPVETQAVKSDKPVVDLYVMSFCPFGNKAEDTMKPVYDLLKAKADFRVHYIVSTGSAEQICAPYIAGGRYKTVADCTSGYLEPKCKKYGSEWICSLHGDIETVQNVREACVLKEYNSDKFWSFMTYVNTNCGSNGACWEAGATTAGIDTAKVNACVASSSLELMKANAALADAAGAGGSPTLIINGVENAVAYQYGNSEAYKQAVCNSFNTAPSECSTSLSTTTGTAQGGSC